jgi:hypothetical protein
LRLNLLPEIGASLRSSVGGRLGGGPLIPNHQSHPTVNRFNKTPKGE